MGGDWKRGALFGDKKSTPLRQVAKGTDRGGLDFQFHAAPARKGGERSWSWAAVSLSMTAMGPPHLGQSQWGVGSWAGEVFGSVCDGCTAASS